MTKNKIELYFVSLHCFSAYPVMNFIITSAKKNYRVNIIENYVLTHFKIRSNRKHFFLGRYDSIAELERTSKFVHYLKHIKIILLYFFYNLNKKTIFYVHDFQILSHLLRLKKLFFKKRSKIIYHQFELIEPHLLNAKDRFFYKIVLKYIDLVDLIIISEENRIKKFKESIGQENKENILLLPNTCEVVKNASPQEINEIRHNFKLPTDKFIVAHIGNLGNDHYEKVFIDIMKNLDKNKYHFVLAGRISQNSKREILDIGEENVTVFIDLPHNQLLKLYKVIDFGFILYKGVNLNFEYCAPNKLNEYWSNGIFVIGHQLGGLKEIFKYSEMGQLFNLDQSNISDGIVALIENTEPNKSKIKNIFSEEYSIHNYLSSFEQALQKI